MKTWYLLIVVVLFLGSCSRIFGAKKVECCEKVAACCYEEMCCLPRYAKAAGIEPKVFTPTVPVYGKPEDFEPAPGETITKPGFFTRFNPFRSPADSSAQDTESEPTGDDEKEGGFFDWLSPF